MTLRVMIADDHSVVLEGLKALLSLEADVEVCGTCADGLEVQEAVKELRPDVLVTDMSMPRCGGLQAYEALREEGVAPPTVILAATLSDGVVVRCLEAAVDGIVLKEAAPSVLLDAIRAVAAGERWIPPELASRAVAHMSDEHDRDGSGLTEREMDVVRLVANGASNKRAAAALGIAQSTVKLHLHSVFRKLEVANRVQLSLLARDRGWV